MDMILLAASDDTAYKVGYWVGKILGYLLIIALFYAFYVCLKKANENRTFGWYLLSAITGLLSFLFVFGFVWSKFLRDEDDKSEEKSPELAQREPDPTHTPPRPSPRTHSPSWQRPPTRITTPRPTTPQRITPRTRIGPTQPRTPSTPRPSITRSNMEYSINVPEPFQLTRNRLQEKTYTIDGQYPIRNVTQPVFTVDAKPFRMGSRDKVEYAKRKLNFLHGFTDAQVDDEVREITIDGLGGYEMVATGTHFMTDTPAIVYQVMLFDEKAYYVMRGMVATAQASKYGNTFQQIAQSFKRKPTD